MNYLCENLKKHFGINLPVYEVTKEAIDDYVLKLERDGKSDGTINRHLSGISKILKEAQFNGKLDAVPKIRKRKEKNGRIRWLTKAEEQAFIDLLTQWGQKDVLDCLIVSVDTGIRASEAMRITPRDIVKEGVYIGESKANIPRLVPLTKRARAVLEARSVIHKDRVFPYDDNFYRDIWERAREHLRMRDVVWHTLRHTCCSRLVQGGMPITHVKEWMGHKAIQTTMRYAHLAPTNLISGVNLLESAVA